MTSVDVICEVERLYSGSRNASTRYTLNRMNIEGRYIPFSMGCVIIDFYRRTLTSVHSDIIRFNPTDPSCSKSCAPFLNKEPAHLAHVIWLKYKQLGINSRLMQITFDKWSVEIMTRDMNHPTDNYLNATEVAVVEALKLYVGEDTVMQTTIVDRDNRWDRFRPSH